MRSRTHANASLNSLLLVLAFASGCMLTGIMMLNSKVALPEPPSRSIVDSKASFIVKSAQKATNSSGTARESLTSSKKAADISRGGEDLSVLDGQRILVAIAAFDFSQLPHLEEVLDGYHDFCVAGAHVDVYIHATIAYPVSLIDLLNSRHKCTNPSPRSGFSITIVLVSPRVRLHLVDFHRPLFYEKIDDYDLFIYTEDDIRVTPRTVAAYIFQTKRVEGIVGKDEASDYNVGIVRYEYDFPSNVQIDDKTRRATQNVTRVYWEHSNHPIVPNAVDAVPQGPLSQLFVHMKNHHQGMFVATRHLLKAWKARTGCRFDEVRDRPGMKHRPSQPTEGTQRVWMSSQMLYGRKHCGVQQLIPIDKFGSLSVLHLPNKNYRRIGKKGRLGGHNSKIENTFPDGTEVFAPTSPLLLSAMKLHIELRRRWPEKPQDPYEGIRMVDNVNEARTPLLQKRMKAYEDYVARGGVMTEEDMTNVALTE